MPNQIGNVQMNITFDRLSNIAHQKIIELNNHPEVIKHMPLANPDQFDTTYCQTWVLEKERQWDIYGYGPWAFLLDGEFIGWGGLQREDDEIDLALVLHPKFWGLGKKLFMIIKNKAFYELGLDSFTILLPISRKSPKAILVLGFKLENQVFLEGEKFNKYRISKSEL